MYNKLLSILVLGTLLVATTLAQQQRASSPLQSATTRGTQVHAVKFIVPGALGDANIMADKFGKVGIGTTAATSPLAVQGMIETTLGGLKFPNGTLQPTASGQPLFTVTHNDTLTGDGRAETPLGIAAGGGNTITPANKSVAAAQVAKGTT